MSNVVPLGEAASKVVQRFQIIDGGKSETVTISRHTEAMLRGAVVDVSHKSPEISRAQGMIVQGLARLTTHLGSGAEAIAWVEGMMAPLKAQIEVRSKARE